MMMMMMIIVQVLRGDDIGSGECDRGVRGGGALPKKKTEKKQGQQQTDDSEPGRRSRSRSRWRGVARGNTSPEECEVHMSSDYETTRRVEMIEDDEPGC
jgi:hypothetical protein